MSADRPGMTLEAVIDSSVDTTITTACQVPSWARFASVYVPAITNAAVTMQMMQDKDATAASLAPTNNTSWAAYADEAESAQIAASGVEATWVDISHLMRAMPLNAWIRFVQGAAETGGSPLTYYVSFRGD